ncbi:MAG TPA: hypothetical protein VFW24_11150 [Acidimicrobiales bacterium]|nr:hypothetical protein [Acidimicrobiales bacterium]
MRRFESVRAAALPWAVGRVVVIGALALSRYLADHVHPAAAVVTRAHEGLLGWDAGYYRDLALQGYAGLPRPAVRFFPLVPLVTRALHKVTGLSAGASLIGLVNVAALLAGVLLYRLVMTETARRDLARRAVWILALAPSAFVLVMGYAEAVLLVLGIGAFLALRTHRWWWAAAAGYLAGLTRPIGLVLVLPALAEVALSLRSHPSDDPLPGQAGSSLRPAPLAHRPGTGAPDLRHAPLTHQLGAAAAVLAPLAGCFTFLGWVGARFGDFWLPLRVQESGNLRGRFSDPLVTVVHDAKDLFHGHVGTGLHVPWLAVFVVLLVVALRRWPLPYGLYALGVLALAVSSANFDSLERYALSAFPFVLAGAGLVSGEETERTVFSILGALLLAYSVLAFLNAVVP